MRAIHLYKFTACLVLVLNALLQWQNWNLFSFSLFPYFTSDIANISYSLALLLIVILVNEKNYKFFPLFNILMFIDTILVYGNMRNFLIHVIFLVAITQMFYYISVRNTAQKDVLKHLVDND